MTSAQSCFLRKAFSSRCASPRLLTWEIGEKAPRHGVVRVRHTRPFRIQSRGAVYRRPVRAGSSQSPAALGQPPALSTAVLRLHAVKGTASGGRAGQRQQRGPALTPPLPGADGPPSPLPATQSHSHSLTVRGVSTSDGVVGTPRVTAALPCGRRQRPGEGSAGARGGRAIYTQFSSMRALIK